MASVTVTDMEEPEKRLEDEFARWGPGQRSVARRLPNNTFEVTLDVGLDAAQALCALTRTAASLGRVVEPGTAGRDVAMRAVIGGGYFNLNPAIVDVRIVDLTATRCRIAISGEAKEGLIRQRAGEGAVHRLLKKANLPG